MIEPTPENVKAFKEKLLAAIENEEAFAFGPEYAQVFEACFDKPTTKREQP
jgi:hypothetical protein